MWEASHWVDGGDIIELFRCTQGMHSENSIVAAQALRPNSREQLRCASLLDVCPTMKNRWVADQSQFANFKLGYLWISWIFFYNSESPVSSQKFCKSTRTLWLFPVQWFFFLPLWTLWTGGAVQCQTSRSCAGSSELGGAALERDDQI